MANKISNKRKNLYYIGMKVAAIGLILFVSTLFAIIRNIETGNTTFDMGIPLSYKTALIGVVCIIIGGFLMKEGIREVNESEKLNEKNN